MRIGRIFPFVEDCFVSLRVFFFFLEKGVSWVFLVNYEIVSSFKMNQLVPFSLKTNYLVLCQVLTMLNLILFYLENSLLLLKKIKYIGKEQTIDKKDERISF